MPNLQPGDIPKPITRAERQRFADEEAAPYHALAVDLMHARAGIACTAYRCTYCREVREGRFRRPQERATASGQGWSQGSRYPVWICHECDAAQGTAPKGNS